MIAVIDYGVGNLFSLQCSLAAIGAESVITGDAEVIQKADKLILPGVGAFGDAAAALEKSGLVPVIQEEVKKGKPLLGICLGMQLLFERSYEYGVHNGLGLLKGEVKPLGDYVTGLKIPHMGWNSLDITASSPLMKYTAQGDYVYFVHSYCAVDCKDSLIATANYGIDVTAVVGKDNVYGTQFHPEKSGDVGLNILKAFSEI